MHSNRTFHWEDRAAMLAFVNDVSFTHLFVQTPDGPRVAHVPVVVTREGNIRFHLARSNALTKHLDGLTAIASVTGPEAYISPDWYGSDDQVPTWNYLAVEAEGPVRHLAKTDLVALLDDISAAQEAKLLPKKPWTRAKMTPGLFEKMLPAIVCFELKVEALRGTVKMGQNKGTAEMEGAAAGLEATGQTQVATLMRAYAKAKA